MFGMTSLTRDIIFNQDTQNFLVYKPNINQLNHYQRFMVKSSEGSVVINVAGRLKLRLDEVIKKHRRCIPPNWALEHEAQIDYAQFLLEKISGEYKEDQFWKKTEGEQLKWVTSKVSAYISREILNRSPQLYKRNFGNKFADIFKNDHSRQNGSQSPLLQEQIQEIDLIADDNQENTEILSKIDYEFKERAFFSQEHPELPLTLADEFNFKAFNMGRFDSFGKVKKNLQGILVFFNSQELSSENGTETINLHHQVHTEAHTAKYQQLRQTLIEDNVDLVPYDNMFNRWLIDQQNQRAFRYENLDHLLSTNTQGNESSILKEGGGEQSVGEVSQFHNKQPLPLNAFVTSAKNSSMYYQQKIEERSQMQFSGCIKGGTQTPGPVPHDFAILPFPQKLEAIKKHEEKIKSIKERIEIEKEKEKQLQLQQSQLNDSEKEVHQQAQASNKDISQEKFSENNDSEAKEIPIPNPNALNENQDQQLQSQQQKMEEYETHKDEFEKYLKAIQSENSYVNKAMRFQTQLDELSAELKELEDRVTHVRGEIVKITYEQCKNTCDSQKGVLDTFKTFNKFTYLQTPDKDNQSRFIHFRQEKGSCIGMFDIQNSNESQGSDDN